MELNAVEAKRKAFIYKLKHENFPKGLTEENLDEEINQREAGILDFEESISEGKKGEFTGVAFVSFQTEPMKQEIIRRFKISNFQRFRQTFQCLKSSGNTNADLFLNGQRLYVSQASEPTDVHWNNLHLGEKERYFRKVMGYVFSGCLLVLCALWIFYLMIKQNELKNTSKNNPDGEEAMKIKALTVMFSFLIVVINKILGYFVPYIALYS